MGMTAALIGALGVAQAGTQIAGGIAANKQAQYNARLYEAQAQGIEESKKLERYKYSRAKRRMAGAITARTAGAGLEMSGSPLAVLVDSLSQIELDEAIGQYNLDLEKSQAIGAAGAYRAQGRAARTQGYMSGFTSLLSTAATANMFRTNTNALGMSGRGRSFGSQGSIGSYTGYRAR